MSPISKNWLRFGIAAAVAALLGFAFAANTIHHLFNDEVQALVDNLGQLSAAAVASVLCAWTASRTTRAERRGWTLLAVSAGIWALGQVVWSYYALVLNTPVPYPSAADFGFLGAAPFAFAAVMSFLVASSRTFTRWRMWLDGLIIVLALTFTGWALGLKDVAIGTFVSEDPLLTRVLNLAYPLADILILTILILAIRRATDQQRGRMLLLLAGLAANSIADSAFDYLSASGTYVAGDFIDSGWVIGYLMVALAALWPESRVDRESADAPVDLWQLALPWTTVILASTTAIGLAIKGNGLDEFMTVLAGLTPILLTVSVLTANRESLAMLVAARAAAATLAQVIARAPAGVVQIDREFRVIDGNPRFRALVAAGGASLTGSPMSKFFSADGYRQFVDKLQSVSDDQIEAVDGDSEAHRLDGTLVWLHWGATVVRTSTGKTDFFIAMFEDTNARHEAEAAASANLGLMERLNDVKTEFLQSVSHEFKTALIGIQGFSELMSDADELNVAEVKTFAADIHRDAERLDRLVTEMVDLDLVETGQAHLNFAAVDINDLVQRKAREADRKHGTRAIEVKLEPTLPPVLGDEERLSEVIGMLLENAAISSPADGRVTIATSASGSGVAVIVKDEGVGVRLEFDNRLFGEDDPYANNPIRKVVGTRLGLGIARQVIEMHGGRLSVVSPVGRGSEFRFTIPVLWRNRQGSHRLIEDIPEPEPAVAV
jgi:two-component system sensor histidine kinase/response regulator